MNLVQQVAKNSANYANKSDSRFIRKDPIPIFVKQPLPLMSATQPLVIRSPPRPNLYFDEVDIGDRTEPLTQLP